MNASPLCTINEKVNKAANHRFYSLLDFQLAYHQASLLERERLFTVFEAMGKLYQYRRLQFDVSNNASAFQRMIDDFMLLHNLKEVYAYLNALTVAGSKREEHDQNLQKLLADAKQAGLTFNEKNVKIQQEKTQA